MIKSNLIKIIVLISILLCMFSNTLVYGSYGREESLNQKKWEQVQKDKQIAEGLKDPTANPSSWKPSIYDEPELIEKAGIVLGVINAIGVVCSVIILAILGIKYMFGSVEEKAEYKKAMIPYIIGVFLIAASTTIPNIIYQFVESMGFI